MKQRSAMALSAALLGSLVAGCGSDEDVAEVAAPPSPAASASPSAAVQPAAALGPFTDSKTELEALYERLRAAKAFHTVLDPREGGFSAKYREVMDFRSGPVTWRNRTYDPVLTQDQIRVGEDLLERRARDCKPRSGRMGDWYRIEGGGRNRYDDSKDLKLVPGALPYWMADLNFVEFTSRKASGDGWIMRGTARLGLSSVKSPIKATLNSAGLPVEMILGKKTGDDRIPYYVVAFSYDDVESIPTVADPKATEFGAPDPCDTAGPLPEAPPAATPAAPAMPDSDSDSVSVPEPPAGAVPARP